ncbi:MAG: PAS domain S-box protein [Candidatus Aminicenantes bacterium]|nr:PAS domain S-box protein [Candidatus Aminicenantes bacterium]
MGKTWQEDDEKMRMFFENTNSLVAILTVEGRYEYVSPSYERLMGYSSEELLGQSGFDHIHPDDVNRLADVLAQGISGEIDRIYGLTYRMTDKNGRLHYLKGNFDSIRDDRGTLIHVGFVGDDISDLRQSEDSLDKEKENFRLLVEAFPLGVLLFDSAQRIVYINSKFTKIFGYTKNDIGTEQDWLKAAYPSPEYRRQILESWKQGQDKVGREDISAHKYSVTCKDGTEKTAVIYYITLEGGQHLIVCQDITRQESIEAQFLHAQKMESIGRLASGIAHDFNNLLTTIIGNADFALMDLKHEDPSYEVVREIKEAADRAAKLTRQLLTFSRKQSRRPEVLSLNMKVRETEKMLKRLIGENIELELLLAPELKPVEIDPGQVEQIIMNLAVNARDAMPSGGKLTIQTTDVELTEDGPISPVELIPGNYVLFSMSDTGTGIPREVQEQIFEPFFTTKEKGRGTGLGLSTVYGVVKQNNGNILIYSEPGMGTTVKIFLPVHTRGASEKRKETGQEVYLHGTEVILLTEDEERVRKIVAMMLKRYGYTVITAGNGQEALHLFKVSDKPVNLLLTDMIMPGMNGLELAKALREVDLNLKVLCMSGHTDTTLFEGLREEGFAFIHKPFSPPALAGKIRELLDR